MKINRRQIEDELIGEIDEALEKARQFEEEEEMRQFKEELEAAINAHDISETAHNDIREKIEVAVNTAITAEAEARQTADQYLHERISILTPEGLDNLPLLLAQKAPIESPEFTGVPTIPSKTELIDSGDKNEPFEGENGNWWIGDEDTGIVFDVDDLVTEDGGNLFINGVDTGITVIKSNADVLIATEAQLINVRDEIVGSIANIKNAAYSPQIIIIALTQSGQAEALAEKYGGFWVEIKTPAPRQLSSILRVGVYVTEINPITGPVYLPPNESVSFGENITPGITLTIAVNVSNSFSTASVRLTSSTRGVIQTINFSYHPGYPPSEPGCPSTPAITGTTFKSITIEMGEILTVENISTVGNPLMSVYYNETFVATEYTYVKIGELI